MTSVPAQFSKSSEERLFFGVKTVVEGTVIPEGKVTVMVEPSVKAPVVGEVLNAMVHGVAAPVTELEGVKVRVPELSTDAADVNVTFPETLTGTVSASLTKVKSVLMAVPLAGLVKPPRMNAASVPAARSHVPEPAAWNSTGLSASVIVTDWPLVTSVPKQSRKAPAKLSSDVGTNVVVVGTTICDGNVTVMVSKFGKSLTVVKEIVQADGALPVVVIGTKVTPVLESSRG